MFEEIVRNMKPHEIVMAMVDGLKNVHYKVQMRTFGFNENGVCCGCAATNAIYEISKKKFTVDNIEDRELRANFLECEYYFLNDFEETVDLLRRGHHRSFLYNLKAIINLTSAQVNQLVLDIAPDLAENNLETFTQLGSTDYNEYLHEYETFATILKSHNY